MAKFLGRSITLALLIIGQFVQAQCLSSPEVLARLKTIQTDAAATNEDKIEALRHLQQLYSKCHNAKDSVYARILHRLGDIYSKTGDWGQAIRFTKEAVTVNTASNKKFTEQSFLANSYFNLGSFHKDLYLFTEAELYFDSCIFFSTSFPDKYFIAFMAFEREAYISFQTGDYQKSIGTADKGILFAQKIKDTVSEAILNCQKAQAQIELNEISAAEQILKKAIATLINRMDTTRVAAGLFIYANLLIKKGEFKAAASYYKKAFELNKAKGNWIQCSRDMTDLGYLYNDKLKDDAKALACYKQGIKMLQQVNDAYQLAALYINMGVVYWGQKNYNQALGFYQKALNALPIGFSDTSIKSSPSENMLRLVANDYFVSTLLSNKGEALLGQYKKEKRADILQAALATYQTADKAVDLMRWKQFGEQSKLFWRVKTKKMYENAIEVCYILNDSEKAYYFFEKSRAVLLNDKLGELGAKKFIAPEDRTIEQQLRINLVSLEQQLSPAIEGSASYNILKQQFLSAQDELERFIKSLEKRYPLYYQYKYNNGGHSLSAVKNMIRQNNQSIIEFFTADSTVYALLISPEFNRFLKINFKEYSSIAKEFMSLCSDRSRLNQNYPRYRTLAYQLYERLFKLLNVPEGRVVISPDEEFIPFEALLSDANDPSAFLLKRYAFSYAYSIGMLMKSVVVTSGSSNSFLGVAPIRYKSYLNLESLNGADHSLQGLTSYFTTSRQLIKEDATKQNFLNNLSLYRTVQIYSHADADSTGKQPVLYLYDSILNLSEIHSMENMHTEMIVLSACRTGIGKHAKGEGVFSLARAFMGAGIPSIVTTLWQVENKATYQLTEAFYKQLSTGVPRDVAMQKAKLEFLERGDKVYKLPYYWAGNILLGKTTNIPFEKVVSKTPFVIVILIVFSFFILVYIFITKRAAPKKVSNK